MADVPLYVAGITAAAGIIGAAIPQVASVFRDVRQAERDRRERSATATREALLALLQAAGELRILAEGISGYRGDEEGLRSRVEQVQSRAEETRLQAAKVSMSVPERLAELADRLAFAASDLANEVTGATDVDEGVLVDDPDVTRLVAAISAFRQAAVHFARG